MPALTISTIRLAAALTEFDKTLSDASTSRAPASWVGNALRFEIGIMSAGVPVDASEIVQVRISAKALKTRAAAYVLYKTTAAITAAVSSEDWTAGTAQHAVIEFTNAEMALDMDGQDAREFFLTVTAITAAGNEITCEAGTLVLHEDYNAPETPAPELTNEYVRADYAACAAFADLPPAPYPGMAVLIESLGWLAVWSGAQSKWLNAMGVEITAADEV